MITQQTTEVSPTRKVEIQYKREPTLFGLISWEVIAKTTTLAKELRIYTESKDIDKIILNGEELVPKKQLK